jgi:hypothetical protein
MTYKCAEKTEEFSRARDVRNAFITLMPCGTWPGMDYRVVLAVPDADLDGGDDWDCPNEIAEIRADGQPLGSDAALIARTMAIRAARALRVPFRD